MSITKQKKLKISFIKTTRGGFYEKPHNQTNKTKY